MIAPSRRWFLRFLLMMASAASIYPAVWAAQEPGASNRTSQDTAAGSRTETTEEYNRRLQEVLRLSGGSANASTDDYRIGAEDLLEISVLEAPELDRTVRVPANGQISLPLIGSSQAAGLTSRELEVVIQELLRRNYMKDPHVSVFVKDMQSHPVSVFGAVKKPGVFQIRGTKTLVQMLSMAEGLADDAGDTVIVMRDGGSATMSPAAVGAPDVSPATPADPPAKSSQASAMQLPPMAAPAGKSVEINLKDLLDSGDPRYNAPVYPGDVVKVSRAGIVYVIGGVTKPGGFLLKTNENISVLQAIALAEGLTHTSAGKRARIIRTDAASGTRKEISINVNRILAGREPDPLLRPKDIVFVPNSAAKAALYRSTEGLTSIVGSAIIYRW